LVRWHSQNTNTYATAAYNRECQEITCSATKTWPVFLSDRKISIMRLRQNQFCISTDLWQTLLVVVVSMQYTTTSHPDVLHPVHVMARISSCLTTSIDENNWKTNKESTYFVMHCVDRCTRPTIRISIGLLKQLKHAFYKAVAIIFITECFQQIPRAFFPNSRAFFPNSRAFNKCSRAFFSRTYIT
jgi:hypothetical protein